MASKHMRRDLPIIEPERVPEHFVSGLADIEECQGVVRATFYADSLVSGAGVGDSFAPRRRIVAVRLFCPLCAYPRILRQATQVLDPLKLIGLRQAH